MTHESLLVAIGKNIKEERMEKGWKGEWVGKKLKVSKAAVCQMEKGEKDFRISELFKIAEILETDVCTLVSVNTIRSKKELEKIISPDKSVIIDTAVIHQFNYFSYSLREKIYLTSCVFYLTFGSFFFWNLLFILPYL